MSGALFNRCLEIRVYFSYSTNGSPQWEYITSGFPCVKPNFPTFLCFPGVMIHDESFCYNVLLIWIKENNVSLLYKWFEDVTDE